MAISLTCTRILGFLLLGLLAFPVSAQAKAWQTEWRAIIAGAKKEGKVVLRAPSDPVLRRELPKEFKRKFGVVLEYLVGRSSEVAAKLRLERRVGVNSMDVFFGGIGTISSVLYADKMLDPLKPGLILPDVLKPANWKKGKLWFSDPEGKYALRLNNSIAELLAINTRPVKPEDLKSVQDLLDPKWKGRIALFDPTVPGTGIRTASAFYALLGEEFVRRLYLDQRPVLTRKRRQLADWLARGTYPLVFGVPTREIERLKEEGFPVTAIYSFPDFGGVSQAGSGILTLINKAPHPNAARLFINWIASREGLGFYSRVNQAVTTCSDLDESFLPAEQIPRPGQAYFDNSDWKYSITTKTEVRLRMKRILRSK
jgi:iron(III) transport system substrate-binding protein